MNNVWTKIGGRKFVAFVLALAAVMVLSFYDKLTSDVTFAILGLVSVFCGGNIGEHLSDWLKGKTHAQQSTPKTPIMLPPDND